VSDDRAIAKWARAARIDCFAPDENLTEKLGGFEFDYLFSIVNNLILSNEILCLPRVEAINYHDAPLPRYAGTHATSWAILNGEKTHGVTWHTIAATVDAGDILKQKSIEIAPHETALTLNTKCFEAAVQTFAELAGELAAGSVSRQPQNLAERTFFPRFKRPANGGVINWKETTENISRLVRALDFGAHPNPLGTAKIFLKNEFFIVREVETRALKSKVSPGTVTRLGDDFLGVAAADGEVVLRRIYRLSGERVSIDELKREEMEVREFSRLPNLSPKMARQIENINAAACRMEKFWTAKLKALKPAPVPFAEQKNIGEKPRRKTRKLMLPENFSRFLEKQNCASKSDLILAAFGALLARLNGQDSFDVGFAGRRSMTELCGIENLFAARLPLRFEVDCRKTFGEQVLKTRMQIEEIEKRSTYALDLPARFPALGKISPLPFCFQVAENLPVPEDSKGADLNIIAADGEPALLLIYDDRKFSDPSIKSLVKTFEVFLDGLAAAPDTPISDIPLVSEREKRKIIGEWNDNRRDYAKDICIHQLFERAARQTPDATALYWNDERISYRQLNEKANRIAHYLQKLGVRTETLVGAALERSPEMIAAILGILKAGGAYLPLDPHYPRERIKLMLEDSDAPFLLTTEKTLATLGERKARVVCLDRDGASIARESPENPVSGVAQKNLAYLIYTSGSTGRPKGVALEHRSAAAFIDWALAVFSPSDLRGTAASTSVCFDLSVFEMFAPLACGASIILLENILHMKDAPARNRVTLINTVPSAIAELVRLRSIPPSVKIVNLAGEPLQPSLVKKIYEIETIEKVYDLYGPTEDTTYSTYTLRDTGAATIGRPIANTQAFILDQFLQVVPVGIAGELYLAGDGLARGYLNRPELTAEKFVKNPFSRHKTARMYKTGDLARFNEKGEIKYLGRIDNQVKIRGFRVELGEIEAVLTAHPSIKTAVVVAHESESGEKRLVAYLVFRENRRLEAAELRESLKQKLPDFMIPSAFVELEEIPLTPNGKIDRKALPAPAAEDFADVKRRVVAHRDALEEKLIGIWENILEVSPIGIRDDFFALGGHSLQAVRMFAELEKTFRVNIPLATLFQAGTVEKLAEILRRDDWSAPESSIVPIQTEGLKPIFFCVHAKGGNVLFYRDLARHLGADQPFYGIQARRLGGRQVGHHDLKEMAEFYIREIKTVQPEGPYYLGGSSFGGLAAFEMARQLRTRGESVGLLALLDTGTPDYPKFLPETNLFRRKIYNFTRRFELHRDNLNALSARQKFDYIWEKLKKVRLKYRRRIRDGYKKTVRSFYARTKGAGNIPKNYIQLEDQIWRAGQNYQPEIYDGDVTLFRATLQPLGIEPDETLGWREFVGGNLEIHDVPGHHGSIVVEPYVAVLAEKLEFCLKKAQRPEGAILEKSEAANSKVRAAVSV
jgi:amino acid adenylation domain-containing protein